MWDVITTILKNIYQCQNQKKIKYLKLAQKNPEIKSTYKQPLEKKVTKKDEDADYKKVNKEKNKLIAIQRAQCKTRLAVWGHNQKNSKLLLSREVG